MREMIVFLRVIIMWYVSGLSCRKSGSCHSHIDGCDCYVPTGITFSFLHPFMCIYAMNWMNFWFFNFFVFSLVLFDGLIITSLVRFVNTFLNFFFNVFVILRFMCIYFIIYLYFLLFSVNSFFISLQTVFCGL